MSQPTQSSDKGQSSGLSELHGKARVSKHDTIMDIRQRLSEMRNTMKELWLFMPTQLLSHGQ